MKISGHLHERVIFTSGQITQLPYAQADGQPQKQYELFVPALVQIHKALNKKFR
jgi:hypothetical protein